MGKGRKPTPRLIKMLTGKHGRGVNEQEPVAPLGMPECPDDMDDKGREMWTKVGEQLYACGILTQLDASAFELLVRKMIAVADAAKMVAKLGQVTIARDERSGLPVMKVNPYWRILKAEEEMLHKMLAEFGLTPTSRTKVKVERKPLDEFEAWSKGAS